LKKTVITNPQILYGEELEVIQRGAIIVNEYGVIEKVVKKSRELDLHELRSSSPSKKTDIKIIDAEGFIVIPGFINSHTHIGDSIGKDIGANLDLSRRIHPHFGIKKTILEKTPLSHLMQMMRNAGLSMLYKGITTFVDFREGGLEGIHLIHEAISDIPIKGIILGRIDFSKFYNKDFTLNRNYKNRTLIANNGSSFSHQKRSRYSRKKGDEDEGKEFQKENIINIGTKILQNCDGFGISGANENTDTMLSLYKKIIRNIDVKNTNPTNGYKKLFLAIHAAEAQSAVKESINKYKKTEIKRTLQLLDPDIYVHVTNPTKSDLHLLHKSMKKIIICPRANGILGVGLAPIKKMLEFNFILGIGTDNVMLNSPDMFKEMDFLIKSQRAFEKNSGFLKAKEILKMATVNGGKIFELNTGCIKRGYLADLLFIDRYDLDLYPPFDPHMALVNRCTEKQVKAIMINGKLTSESICFN
jgi:cytosine/adenosine deaminase-related metal-dependent hydrolase